MMQELRAWYDGPIALSGSIASGKAVLSAQAMGADFAYVGSAFIATHEANATDPYKQAVVDGNSESIVNSNLFTGVHGNYLRVSIENSGLDPDNLPESDPSKMDFGSGGNTDAKARARVPKARIPNSESAPQAWKDIWGCGQGIAPVERVAPAGEFVAELAAQYAAAQARLAA